MSHDSWVMFLIIQGEVSSKLEGPSEQVSERHV